MKPSKWFVAATAVALGLTSPVWAESGKVTFTKDVLPILQENCQSCHRASGRNMSGMIAPMSFMSYQEVRPWAKAIARVVDTKVMPPWDASENQHGIFQNERTLTKDQIATIVAWVEQGAARGNPDDAPVPVAFKEGWLMGEPDLELAFPEPFFVQDDIQDLYHNITIKLTEEQLSEEKWVQSLEFRPGSEVVHHIIAYAANEDAPEIDESVSSEGDEEFLRSRVMLGGLAPGTDPTNYPEGYGIPLRPGSQLTFAMHYHKEAGPGTGKWDNSVMAFKFHDKPVQYPLNITNIAHGAFEVPPFHPNWKVVGAKTFDNDIQLISLMPHMHLRGSYAKYTAYYPNGAEEVLLEVPQYDFNWQTQYEFEELKQIPAGTRIEFEMHYDNSKENAERVGFNPAQAVSFGGPTTDEMDLGWYTAAPAKPLVNLGAGD
jgi:mono/diheme cytochrome c family protein